MDQHGDDPSRARDSIEGLFQRVPLPVATFGSAGELRWVNPAWEVVLGRSLATLRGQDPIAELYPDPADRAVVMRNISEANGRWYESNVALPEGRGLAMAWAYVRMSNGITLALGRDLSAQRETETRMRHAQKLETLARLSGGIAHDFNNRLTTIVGLAELASEAVPEQYGEARAHLQEIMRVAIASATGVRQLVSLTRPQSNHPEVLDSNDVLRAYHELLRRLVGTGIEIELDLAADVPLVYIDRAQLEQILLNVGAHAAETMPSGGRLRIRSGRLERRTMGFGQGNSETHAELSFTDTGTGLAPDALADALAPRTGFGLAAVDEIARANGGRVTIESRLGEGTTVRVLLPETNRQRVHAPTKRGERRALRGHETVVVADDDRGVLRFVRDVLGQYGYDVHEAASGPEAVERLVRLRDRVDLLITDIVMPRMSGREIAELFGVLSPTARVLFMSGYAADEVLHHGLGEDRARFLPKPFASEDLLRQVRDILDSPQPRPSSGG